MKKLLLITALLLTSAYTYTESLEPVQAGTEFTINLRANTGSTGFSWQVDESKTINAKLVKKAIAAEETELIEPDVITIGASKLWKYTFQAGKPGPGRIVLHYARPWDPAEKQLAGESKTFEFTVTE